MKKSKKVGDDREDPSQILNESHDENPVSIPVDLIIDILAKLAPKSLAKFISVSKLWYSIIRGKVFTDLFMAHSLARPCFLFTFSRDENSFFHSVFYKSKSPSSLHHNGTSCTTPDQGYTISPPVRGLMCCRNASKVVIFNPSTGQVAALPKVKTRRKGVSSFLGYDPVNHVYKVLCMTIVKVPFNRSPFVSEEHQVFTLGAEKKSWRKIDCHIPHCPATEGLCRNRVVYYGAWSDSDHDKYLIMCFDVGSEQFSLVKLPEDVEIQSHHRSELVNYHNKIAIVDQTYGGEVELWVLEDVEKQEWSKLYLVVPSWNDLVGHNRFFRCRGTISTGEFIFTPHSHRHQLTIVYYDLKEDNARRVEIEGIENGSAVTTVFVDHVENPMFL